MTNECVTGMEHFPPHSMDFPALLILYFPFLIIYPGLLVHQLFKRCGVFLPFLDAADDDVDEAVDKNSLKSSS